MTGELLQVGGYVDTMAPPVRLKCTSFPQWENLYNVVYIPNTTVLRFYRSESQKLVHKSLCIRPIDSQKVRTIGRHIACRLPDTAPPVQNSEMIIHFYEFIFQCLVAVTIMPRKPKFSDCWLLPSMTDRNDECCRLVLEVSHRYIFSILYTANQHSALLTRVLVKAYGTGRYSRPLFLAVT